MPKFDVRSIINIVISVIRNFVSPEVVAAIKQAALDAFINFPEKGKDERTNYVINQCRHILETTANPYDEMFFDVLVNLYLRKYLKGR